MLCRKKPFNVDIVIAAPVKNTKNTVYHLGSDAFELLIVIEVHIDFDLFVIVVEIHKRLIVAVFFESLGKFTVAKCDSVAERVHCIFFVPTVNNSVSVNVSRKVIYADIERYVKLLRLGAFPKYSASV